MPLLHGGRVGANIPFTPLPLPVTLIPETEVNDDVDVELLVMISLEVLRKEAT